MIKILFICHGNICRSPMAEFVMKDLVRKAGISDRIHIASAAVSREEIGNPVYPPARRELEEYNKIYYMDASNARYLKRLFGSDAEKCQPLLDHDVADPWYTCDFTATWNDVLSGCQAILEEIL